MVREILAFVFRSLNLLSTAAQRPCSRCPAVMWSLPSGRQEAWFLFTMSTIADDDDLSETDWGTTSPDVVIAILWQCCLPVIIFQSSSICHHQRVFSSKHSCFGFTEHLLKEKGLRNNGCFADLISFIEINVSRCVKLSLLYLTKKCFARLFARSDCA